MRRQIVSALLSLTAAAGLLLAPAVARAELPWETDLHTRYAALGDSLPAGFGAVPITQGYVYLLYQRGVFDSVPNTILANLGVPGATSQVVLDHQVPQLCANAFFHPDVITLNVGGNDLLLILNGSDPGTVLATFGANLFQILLDLRTCPPNARIYVGNQYEIPEIPGAEQLIAALNNAIEGVAAIFHVPVADVHEAFLGKTGLLLIERHGADPFQVHPTNAGYRVIADAFEAVINSQ
jgi:lysophospholipase L1-like esterase